MQTEIGFDNEKYLQMQSEKILERISTFDNKLYLEFGGKLFDDYHASRVLPGFQADSKLQMLLTMADQAEMVMVVSAQDIESSKEREDLGITYDSDVLRLIGEYRKKGLFIGSVVITKYLESSSVRRFEEKLVTSGLRVYHHYLINGYPTNVELVISDEGYGKNDYIETTRPLIVVTAPGPGSGKMSTCLSQLYHEHKRGINAGYAKFETFPIWNLPLDHPVNLAYEAATADLNDINMIDPYHLKAHGETTVNYNRDVEIFPLLYAMFERIFGKSPYESPTDMGVNMAGYCIINDEVCREASRQEIIRRYYHALQGVVEGKKEIEEVNKIRVLMSQENLTAEDRAVVVAAQEREKETGDVATAIELPDGTIITGKTSDLLGPSAACLIKAIKHLAGLPKETKILSPESIAPIQKLKTQYLGSRNPRLHPDEVLVALSSNASKDADAALALDQLPKLKNCAVHTTAKLSAIDRRTFKRLGCDLTYDPKDL
ncbi:MAG: DUF1846 domain-containing protein [Lachnospiraceae bacterium]|nr:DUF1846 domain-containing protein [Lachnospiraceae bacterium]